MTLATACRRHRYRRPETLRRRREMVTRSPFRSTAPTDTDATTSLKAGFASRCANSTRTQHAPSARTHLPDPARSRTNEAARRRHPAEPLSDPLPCRRQPAAHDRRPVPATPQPALRSLPHPLRAQYERQGDHPVRARQAIQPRDPRHPPLDGLSSPIAPMEPVTKQRAHRALAPVSWLDPRDRRNVAGTLPAARPPMPIRAEPNVVRRAAGSACRSAVGRPAPTARQIDRSVPHKPRGDT